jgi:hypothetical protein
MTNVCYFQRGGRGYYTVFVGFSLEDVNIQLWLHQEQMVQQQPDHVAVLGGCVSYLHKGYCGVFAWLLDHETHSTRLSVFHADI